MVFWFPSEGRARAKQLSRLTKYRAKRERFGVNAADGLYSSLTIASGQLSLELSAVLLSRPRRSLHITARP